MIWLNCGPIHASTLLATSFLYSYYSIKYTEYRTPFRIDMNKERVFLFWVLTKFLYPYFDQKNQKMVQLNSTNQNWLYQELKIWFSFSFWMFNIGNIGGNIHFWSKHQSTQTIFDTWNERLKLVGLPPKVFWMAWLE